MINNAIDRYAFIGNFECDINRTNSLKHFLNNTKDEYDIIPLSTYNDLYGQNVCLPIIALKYLEFECTKYKYKVRRSKNQH